MIIPARWYSGGKGLDDFRRGMLDDTRIRNIVDFPEAVDIFPGVQIKGGVCYFLWDRDQPGQCKVTSMKKGQIHSEMIRPLKEENCEVFIRHNEAISILHKVRQRNEPVLLEQVSPRNPFGIISGFQDFSKHQTATKSIKLYRYGDDGYISHDQIPRNRELIDKIKVIVSKAGSGSDTYPHQILGRPLVSEPNSVCTETYLILGISSTQSEAENLISYVSTRFFRFLVALVKNTQNVSRSVYQFVPIQDLSHPWTDDALYAKYGLTADEIAFIESLIRPME
jgi:site-specific DNA-methyltransferase (adenine-specific)